VAGHASKTKISGWGNFFEKKKKDNTQLKNNESKLLTKILPLLFMVNFQN